MREVAIAMTREDRCGYRVERFEKSRRRRRGDTTGSGLAAERGIGVQRVEALPIPALSRGTARTANPRHAKTVG